MYIQERNFYISETYNILFDLNQFRIFYITDELCKYFKNEENNLNENEKDTLKGIMSSDTDKTLNESQYRAVKIHVSNMCNLRCKYCYAQGGNYGVENALMDMETAKKVVDFINTEKELEHIKYITFFGGEPLINPDVIEYICENTCNRNVEYLLQTNGTIINERIIRILKKYAIGLTVSLDGPKEVNDFNRIDSNGNGTYNKIITNIQILKKNGIMPKAIEATMSGEFIERYSKKEIADYLFDNTGIREISVIDDMNLKANKNLEEKVEKEVTLFFEKCLSGKYIMGNNAYKIIHSFFSGSYNDYICSAGNGSLSFNVKGEIFPCQLFLEKPEWKMGGIDEGFSKKMLYIYKKSLKDKCKKCSAKSTCSLCLAMGIQDDMCNETRLWQKLTLEKLAQCIRKGNFEKFYQNFSLL